jgi:two-component system, chemotaxis family, protein-glutamate methylesterase/glutaminase
MAAIRVLAVDDSVVVHRLLVEALTADPGAEVAGTAPDGQVALTKIPLVRPDLTTLDVEMSVMSGLETLRESRKLYPRLPVIMFSTLTERGATTTLDALTLGASDYITKPSNTGGVEQTRARIQADLIPKVKALCKAPREENLASASAVASAPPIEARRGLSATWATRAGEQDSSCRGGFNTRSIPSLRIYAQMSAWMTCDRLSIVGVDAHG